MSLKNPATAHRTALFARFDEAAENAAAAAITLEKLLKTWPDSRELADEIRTLERNGDRITHDLLHQLQRSYSLPFDREDGHRLASSVDDLLDYIDEAAEHLVIYKVDVPLEH